MKLAKLQLENFRNYPVYQHEFHLEKACTILVGQNGQGKTNFLEGVYALSLGRSFRSRDPEDLINWGQDFLRCRGELIQEDGPEELEFFYSKSPRRQRNLRKNGVNTPGSRYIGTLITVLFHPEDLNMLYLTPSLRRRYLDTVLSQVSHEYLIALSSYQKVLKQRNSLLQTMREQHFSRQDLTISLGNLQIWDQQIINFGSIITDYRQKFIQFLQERLEGFYQSISGNQEPISISYQSRITEGQSLDLDGIRQSFAAVLAERQNRDIMQSRTTMGPHRDDLEFRINNQEISTSASRGEFRTLLLAIKMAEIAYIEHATTKKPLLLLDDVFSELDLARQGHLLRTIVSHQSIITTTDLAYLEELLGQSEVIEV